MRVFIQCDDLGEDVECEVKYDFTRATEDVFNPATGEGCPGDREHIEITELFVLSWGGVNIPPGALTESAYEGICDQISEYERKAL